MKNLPILIKREIWEHPAFYIAPAIIFGLMVLGLLLGAVNVDLDGIRVNTDDIISHMDDIPQQARVSALSLAYAGVSILFVAVMPFIAFFYLVDTLYAERKERHILFWKSLPTSDAETVLSKVIAACFVIPLCFSIGILLTYIIFLMVGSFELPGEVSAIGLLWKPAPIFKMFLTSLYTFTVMSLWFLPFIGWFLLSGTLIKRVHPFIIAIVTPLLLFMVEGLFFGTTYFVDWVSNRFIDWIPEALSGFVSIDDDALGNAIETGELLPWTMISPVNFLTSTGLWIGAAIGSAFIAAAIYLRRYRDDS